MNTAVTTKLELKMKDNGIWRLNNKWDNSVAASGDDDTMNTFAILPRFLIIRDRRRPITACEAIRIHVYKENPSNMMRLVCSD